MKPKNQKEIFKMEERTIKLLIYFGVIAMLSIFVSPLVAVIGGIVLTPKIVEKITKK